MIDITFLFIVYLLLRVFVYVYYIKQGIKSQQFIFNNTRMQLCRTFCTIRCTFGISIYHFLTSYQPRNPYNNHAKNHAILRGFHIFSYSSMHISGIFQYSAFAIFRLLCLFVLRLPHTLRLRHGFQAFVTIRFGTVFECFFSLPRF